MGGFDEKKKENRDKENIHKEMKTDEREKMSLQTVVSFVGITLFGMQMQETGGIFGRKGNKVRIDMPMWRKPMASGKEAVRPACRSETGKEG